MNASPAVKLQLLLVDDDAANLRFLAQLLAEEFAEQVEVYAAEEVVDAFQWLEENLCDIVLSDINILGFDCLQLVQLVKLRNARTQIALITDRGSLDRFAEAAALGASDYLLRPLQRQNVVDVVTQLCRQAESATADESRLAAAR